MNGGSPGDKEEQVRQERVKKWSETKGGEEQAGDGRKKMYKEKEGWGWTLHGKRREEL